MSNSVFTISPKTTGHVFSDSFTLTFKQLSALPTSLITSPAFANLSYATLTANNVSFVKFAWDLGDGTVQYNNQQITKIYNYPGTYTVSVSGWLSNGTPPLTAKDSITVDYLYQNNIKMIQLPNNFGAPGRQFGTPFVVSLTSTEIQQPINITLQALNSPSTPLLSVADKWRFIAPTWHFVNADDGSIGNTIPVKTAPIYAKDVNGTSRVVAVTGSISFYYVDSVSTDVNSSPILVIASIDASDFVYPPESVRYPYPSYANNSGAKVAALWRVNPYLPTSLKVTENFINDIYPQKWTGVPIPVMVTTYFDSKEAYNFTYATALTADVLEYPYTNANGSLFPLYLSLSSESGTVTEGDCIVADGSQLYFQSTDSQNNPINGYVFTTVTPTVSANEKVAISALTYSIDSESVQLSSSQQYRFPKGYPIYSDAYISNPFTGKINKINLVNTPVADSNIDYYRNLGVLSDGTLQVLNVPNVSAVSVQSGVSSISATDAVCGFAFNPYYNKMYAFDSNQDSILEYDGDGNLIQNVSLYTRTLSSYNVPSSITIDKNHNVWVAMYRGAALLKMDSNLVTQFVINLPYITSGGLIAPPQVEADRDGNVWVCYATNNNSYLLKYSESGQYIRRAHSFSAYNVPVSLAIDINNNVWVANKNTNTVQCYSTDTGLLLDSITGVSRPNFLNFDRSGNLWFVHSYNNITQYNPNAQSYPVKTIFQVNPSNSTMGSYLSAESVNGTVNPWGGFTIDVYDRAWLINSLQNTIMVFNTKGPRNLRVVTPVPSVDNNKVLNPSYPTLLKNELSNNNIPTAFGDWTGNKWYQKFATVLNTNQLLLGSSAPFIVSDVEKTYTVSKVNEEKDMSAYLQSLALPEMMNQNTEFWNKFMAAVAGDGNPMNESAGRIIYEKIANFVQTHGDFETSEINQLLSYAEQLSVPANAYSTDYPREINRLLSLFSVPKHLLRGRYNYDTDPVNNTGGIITQSTPISAGEYIVAIDRQFNTYQLIYVSPLIDGTLVYPLSTLEVPGLKTPLSENYNVFQWSPALVEGNQYIDNIINWNSDYTTVDYTVSSNDEWYGDLGLLENMFNSAITRNMFTPITSGSYIPNSVFTYKGIPITWQSFTLSYIV